MIEKGFSKLEEHLDKKGCDAQAKAVIYNRIPKIINIIIIALITLFVCFAVYVAIIFVTNRIT